jgi:hypothetical protein
VLHAHFGSRSDGFYLRFLQFNEVYEPQLDVAQYDASIARFNMVPT